MRFVVAWPEKVRAQDDAVVHRDGGIPVDLHCIANFRFGGGGVQVHLSIHLDRCRHCVPDKRRCGGWILFYNLIDCDSESSSMVGILTIDADNHSARRSIAAPSTKSALYPWAIHHVSTVAHGTAIIRFGRRR
jgi:hypothetical protein